VQAIFAACGQNRGTVNSRMLMEHNMLHLKHIDIRTVPLLNPTAHWTQHGFTSICARVTYNHVTYYVGYVQEHSGPCMNVPLRHAKIYAQYLTSAEGGHKMIVYAHRQTAWMHAELHASQSSLQTSSDFHHNGSCLRGRPKHPQS
jgi:hypothetical protein